MRLTTLLVMICLAATARGDEVKRLTAGADVSMLLEIEKAGGTFKDADGNAADAIRVLRDNGCELFRLRLFVDPSDDFASTWGATQDIRQVRALGKRVKAAGGKLLLDLHYSDTWADPGKQAKPKAWAELDFDALERQVTAYTADVIRDLRAHGAAPDMVQVGNEITSGMLFPDGKVLDAPQEREKEQWTKFARLFNAGVRGVRQASEPVERIPVMLHIHGGGRPGLPGWFLGKFTSHDVEFDVIGVSFYPAWGDSLDALRDNLRQVAETYQKDIYVAETSYPWRPMPEMEQYRDAMTWPATPEGQVRFVEDLAAALRDVPHGCGAGFIWWYPEAIPVKDRFIWRGGAEALYDEAGRPLPALLQLSGLTGVRQPAAAPK